MMNIITKMTILVYTSHQANYFNSHALLENTQSIFL